MRKLILDIHIYSSLLCTGYLLIYGLSTLSFNHYHEPEETLTEWTRNVETLPALGNEELAASVREQLGLIGYIPPWRIQRKSAEEIRFEVDRPARAYRIHLHGGAAHVAETCRGLWGALRGLHGLNRIPGSS